MQLNEEMTKDAFLGGKIHLYQPRNGYRAGIDPVFLSAAIVPQENDKILDLGCGVGSAGLLLLKRFQTLCSIHVTGFEKDTFLCALARKNATLNGLQDLFSVVCGDLKDPPPEIFHQSFNQIITNPPYFEGEMISPNHRKAHANHALSASFEVWIDFCIKRLKPFGCLTMIIPPQKLPEVLKISEGRLGGFLIYPLWPRDGIPAKRILFQGTKDRKTPLQLLKGLVLHAGGRDFTPEAHGILWEGNRLVWKKEAKNKTRCDERET